MFSALNGNVHTRTASCFLSARDGNGPYAVQRLAYGGILKPTNMHSWDKISIPGNIKLANDNTSQIKTREGMTRHHVQIQHSQLWNLLVSSVLVHLRNLKRLLRSKTSTASNPKHENLMVKASSDVGGRWPFGVAKGQYNRFSLGAFSWAGVNMLWS